MFIRHCELTPTARLEPVGMLFQKENSTSPCVTTVCIAVAISLHVNMKNILPSLQPCFLWLPWASQNTNGPVSLDL